MQFYIPTNTHIFYVSDFHPGNRGSKPLGDAISQARHLPGFFLSGAWRLRLVVLSHLLLSAKRSRHTTGLPVPLKVLCACPN